MNCCESFSCTNDWADWARGKQLLSRNEIKWDSLCWKWKYTLCESNAMEILFVVVVAFFASFFLLEDLVKCRNNRCYIDSSYCVAWHGIASRNFIHLIFVSNSTKWLLLNNGHLPLTMHLNDSHNSKEHWLHTPNNNSKKKKLFPSLGSLFCVEWIVFCVVCKMEVSFEQKEKNKLSVDRFPLCSAAFWWLTFY